MRLFEILREDFRRYYLPLRDFDPRFARLKSLLTYGFLATCVYRYGRWAMALRPRWLAAPFKLLYVMLRVATELVLGIRISVNSEIGPGLYIGHFGGIFIRCRAGRHLTLSQDVTVGSRGAGQGGGWPVFGNDIYVGAGAKIIGEVCIGDGVIIGANTVVTKDVPAQTRVVGAAVRMDPIMSDTHAQG